uniref:ALAAT2 n=1 Tax=Arundo donax TaxID=35708 RepID=A0A0A9E7Y0_ARUDO
MKDLFFLQMRFTKKIYTLKISNSTHSKRLHDHWDTLMMIFLWYHSSPFLKVTMENVENEVATWR